MKQSLIPPLTLTNIIGNEPMTREEQAAHREKFMKKRAKAIALETEGKPDPKTKEKVKDEKPKN